MDSSKHVVAITWTNNGGEIQLIIDGVLQSTLLGIEANGKISGQNRFIVGGSDTEMKTLKDALLHNLNVWDEVSINSSVVSLLSLLKTIRVIFLKIRIMLYILRRYKKRYVSQAFATRSVYPWKFNFS